MKTSLLVVLCVVFGLLAQTSVAAVPANGAKSTDDQSQKLANDYLATTVEKEKVAALEGLLKINSLNSHLYFYALFLRADTVDLSRFRTATHNFGEAEMLIDLSSFMKVLQQRLVDELRQIPNPTEKDVAATNDKIGTIIDELLNRLNVLDPEFAIITRKNPKVLIAEIERIFLNKDHDFLDPAGPMFGFLALKEEGATLLLRNIEGEGALIEVSRAFGPYTVIPALKQFEDPASTKSQHTAAGIVILSFVDRESVYDKVVEAYKHGRYFELKQGTKDKDGVVTMTADDLMEASLSWWGNHVEVKYKNNKQFFDYVAKTYLPKTEGQDQVIRLLASTNFGLAAPHLMKLDIATLSEKSLDMLIHFASVSDNEDELAAIMGKKGYVEEKFALYNKLFQTLSPKVRESKKIMYTLANFPPEDRIVFVKTNVDNFTDDEKETIVFLCDSLLKKTPADTRKKIYDILRKNASKDLLKTIESIETRKE